MRMIKYDAGVLQEHVERLYRKAAMMAWEWAIGLFLLAGIGSLILVLNFPKANENPGFGVVVAVALLAGFVGWLIGHSAGFKYRLQAQLVLCQMQIEYNTRRVGAASTGS